MTVAFGDPVGVESLALDVDEFITARQDGDFGSVVDRDRGYA